MSYILNCNAMKTGVGEGGAIIFFTPEEGENGDWKNGAKYFSMSKVPNIPSNPRPTNVFNINYTLPNVHLSQNKNVRSPHENPQEFIPPNTTQARN